MLVLLSYSLLGVCQQTNHLNEKKEMIQENLIELVQRNDLAAVKSALAKGAKVNTQDSHKRNLLLIATVNQQLEMAQLLVAHGADVNMQADNLDSPFLYAGASGQTTLVKLYLENGARFDVFNRYHGSALIPACERGHVETVKVLVNAKDFPIDHVNRLGWTALLEAVILGDGSEKYQEIIKILKNGGANLLIPDKDGVTALQHAQKHNYKEIVNILQ